VVGLPVLLSMSGAAPALLARSARAASAAQAGNDRRDTVLVIVQLSGGNDGFNSVVPYADDAYGRSRTTLRLTAKDVLKIDDYVGFHPKMTGFSRLLKDGQLCIVQDVGYPQSDRDHERAMLDWHTAHPEDRQCPTGWLGRAIDAACARNPASVPGVFVGPIARPFALAARQAVVPSIQSAQDLTMTRDIAPAADAATATAAGAAANNSHANPLMAHIRQCTGAAGDMSRRIRAVLAEAPGADRYPPQGLAEQLKTVAELVRADVGIRVFFTELGGGGIGGFDNHASQRDNHAALLKQLSDSVAAFAADLARQKCLGRVLVMTFSEFGRSLAENGRRGTDHGAAAPMFLVGGRVRPGLFGERASLTDLDQGATRPKIDFRRLYATVLDRWLGFDSEAALGAKFQPLDLL
jgi:uncharacterized protein (DUF1501 family)